jgi:hypothetical protein
MTAHRIAVVSFALFMVGAPLVLAAGAPGRSPSGHQAAQQDFSPAFGTWKFTGKDKNGVAWTGTLILEKPNPDWINPQKYVAGGKIEIESADGAGKGLDGGVAYDPVTRVITIGDDSDYGGAVYTAVISPDWKSLTKGVWRETDRLTADNKKPTLSEGEWSATQAEK